jgi:hypothetical protein
MQLRRQRASLTARLRRWWPGRRSVASILRHATPYHRRGLAFEHRDGSLVTVDHLVLTYDAVVAVHEVAVSGRVRGRSADPMWQVQREPGKADLANPLIAAQRGAQAVGAALGQARLPVIAVVVVARARLDLAICRPHCVCDRAGLTGLARRWSQPDGEAHAALWRGLIARARPHAAAG